MGVIRKRKFAVVVMVAGLLGGAMPASAGDTVSVSPWGGGEWSVHDQSGDSCQSDGSWTRGGSYLGGLGGPSATKILTLVGNNSAAGLDVTEASPHDYRTIELCAMLVPPTLLGDLSRASCQGFGVQDGQGVVTLSYWPAFEVLTISDLHSTADAVNVVSGVGVGSAWRFPVEGRYVDDQGVHGTVRGDVTLQALVPLTAALYHSCGDQRNSLSWGQSVSALRFEPDPSA